MGSVVKQWVLDDDSVVTTKMVMDEVGCSHSSAFYRLTKSTNREEVFRPREKHKIHNGKRLYVLDDGSEWTSTMVAEHTGCLLSTASTRLSCYTDPAVVLAPPKDKGGFGKSTAKEVTNYISSRMFYDPDDFWKLLNRWT